MKIVTPTRCVLALSLLLAVVGLGCLPIELSVSPAGEILIPRAEGFVVYQPTDRTVKVWHKPQNGDAAFAMYAPDGKSAIAMVAAEGGGMGQGFKALLMTPDGQTRELLNKSNVTYLQWSPDGKSATLTAVANQKKPPLEQNMPELVLVDVEAGTNKTLAGNVAGIHRWLPDGKHVVIFQIERKSEQGNQYAGKLTKLNVETGETSDVAGMMGEQSAFFDVSPDGKMAMVTALAVDAVDATLPENVEGKAKLYAVNMESGAAREVADAASYAIYSPKGSHVLIGTGGELSVASPAGEVQKVIAEDAATSAGGGGMGAGSATIYPTWLDEETVLYLSEQAVYGTAGKNLQLMSVKVDGSQRTRHQSIIDAGLQKGE